MKYEFYVLNYDFNKKKVYNYNIFNNIRVQEATEKLLKKYKKENMAIEDFTEELKSIVKWQEWSRRQYEISVGDAFETDIEKFEKWDCYGQFEPNARIVAEYLVAHFG